MINIKEIWANWALLCLFGGFFIYHFLLGQGLIGPVLGGFFGNVSVIFMCLLMVATFMCQIKRPSIVLSKICVIDLKIIFILFQIYSLTVASVNFIIGSPGILSKELYIWSIQEIFLNVLMFNIGAYVSLKFIAKIGSIVIPLFFLCMLLNVTNGIFNAKINAGANYDFVSTYQGFARSILVLGIISSAYSAKMGMASFLLIIITLLALFICGARSEFLMYSVGLTPILIGRCRSLRFTTRLLFFGGILAILCASYFEEFANSRILSLLNIFTEINSGSNAGRMSGILFAISKINDSPLFGDYGAYVVLKGIGSYPHNFMLVWLNYGILGLVFYILLFMATFYKLYIFWNTLQKPERNVILCFLTGVCVAILFTKVHSYMLVGLIIGLVYQYARTEKYD